MNSKLRGFLTFFSLILIFSFAIYSQGDASNLKFNTNTYKIDKNLLMRKLSSIFEYDNLKKQPNNEDQINSMRVKSRLSLKERLAKLKNTKKPLSSLERAKVVAKINKKEVPSYMKHINFLRSKSAKKRNISKEKTPTVSTVSTIKPLVIQADEIKSEISNVDVNYSCYDSDGKNFYNKGYAKGWNPYLGKIIKEIDSCGLDRQGALTLVGEAICDRNEVKIIFEECENGCKNGACKKEDIRTPPSQVTGVNVDQISTNSVKLTWDEATSDSGVIVGYKIYYGTISGNYSNYIETDSSLSSVVNNLIFGETYYFAIKAIDDELNMSEDYSEEVSATPQEIPFSMLQVDVERTDGWNTRELSLENGQEGETVMKFSLKSWLSGSTVSLKKIRFRINDGFNSYSFAGAEVLNENGVLIGSIDEISSSQGSTHYLEIFLNENLTYNNPEEFSFILKLQENYIIEQQNILDIALESIEYEFTSVSGIQTSSSTSNNLPLSGPHVVVIPSVPDQSISLKEGWNLISSYINPQNTDIEEVFAGLILQEDSLLQVKNETKSFNPNLPDYLNTLNSFEGAKGYYVKVNRDTTLHLIGEDVTLPYTYNLNKGWNLIGYPRELSTPYILCMLHEIYNQNDDILEEVKDGDGNRLYKNNNNTGTSSDWEDEIGEFTPGEGYFIKVNQNASINIINNGSPCI